MTLFDRMPARLDEPHLIEAAIAGLSARGYDRIDIEAALIRAAPVDLDLLAQCYLTLFGDDPSGAACSKLASQVARPVPAAPPATSTEPAVQHLRRAA